MKIAVLLNETSGPLQQHLQLHSGQSPNYARVKQTIIEYYRLTTAFSKLQQLRSQSSSVATSFGGGQAPMDIDAIHKGKGKYNNYKGKGKGKGTKAKATEDTTATDTIVTTPITKEKESMEEKDSTAITTVRSASAIHSEEATKETKDTTKAKERTKENKQQTHATGCGRTGHYAKECRVAIHNIGQGESNDIEDTTTQWYDDYYDNGWYFQDYTRPLALPPIPSTSSHDMTPIHVIAVISNGNDHKTDTTTGGTTDTMHIMIDSGAATHVCPLWHYGLQTTIQCTRSNKHKPQTSGQ